VKQGIYSASKVVVWLLGVLHLNFCLLFSDPGHVPWCNCVKRRGLPQGGLQTLRCAHRINQCSRCQKWSPLFGPKFVLSLIVRMLLAVACHLAYSWLHYSIVDLVWLLILQHWQHQGVPPERMYATAHAPWRWARNPLHLCFASTCELASYSVLYVLPWVTTTDLYDRSNFPRVQEYLLYCAVFSTVDDDATRLALSTHSFSYITFWCSQAHGMTSYILHHTHYIITTLHIR
jgi:hypothetical protein